MLLADAHHRQILDETSWPRCNGAKHHSLDSVEVLYLCDIGACKSNSHIPLECHLCLGVFSCFKVSQMASASILNFIICCIPVPLAASTTGNRGYFSRPPMSRRVQVRAAQTMREIELKKKGWRHSYDQKIV